MESEKRFFSYAGLSAGAERQAGKGSLPKLSSKKDGLKEKDTILPLTHHQDQYLVFEKGKFTLLL